VHTNNHAREVLILHSLTSRESNSSRKQQKDSSRGLTCGTKNTHWGELPDGKEGEPTELNKFSLEICEKLEKRTFYSTEINGLRKNARHCLRKSNKDSKN
jgi:hypothetical protein